MNGTSNGDERPNSTGNDGPRREGGPPEERIPGQRPRSRRESSGRRPGESTPSRVNASDGGPDSRPPKRAGGPGGPPEQRDGREGRKRRKDGSDRRGLYGFGDAIERATCTSYYHATPDIWPVQSHAGTATLRAVEVDRRPAAILYCDGAHAGSHIWPDDEIVLPPEDRPLSQDNMKRSPPDPAADFGRGNAEQGAVPDLESDERDPATIGEH